MAGGEGELRFRITIAAELKLFASLHARLIKAVIVLPSEAAGRYAASFLAPEPTLNLGCFSFLFFRLMFVTLWSP